MPNSSSNPFSNRGSRLKAMKQLKPKVAQEAQRRALENANNTTCPECGDIITPQGMEKSLWTCPRCGYHFKMSAPDRLAMVFDNCEYSEMYANVVGDNPLHFPGYSHKLEANRQKSGLKEAVVCAAGNIGGNPCVVDVLDSRFLMGSMGVAVGEKITRSIEYATGMRLPIIIFSASGGARMQEGIYSLMQMAKTSAAIQKHDEAGLLFISVLTNPTTGGVTASFASLGDVILAETGALIGFAGPRVIEQTIGQKLPEGFQRAEYLLEHGFVDRIVERQNLRDELATLLAMHVRRG